MNFGNLLLIKNFPYIYSSALALAANNISKYLCEQAFSNRRSNIAYALYGWVIKENTKHF